MRHECDRSNQHHRLGGFRALGVWLVGFVLLFNETKISELQNYLVGSYCFIHVLKYHKLYLTYSTQLKVIA